MSYEVIRDMLRRQKRMTRQEIEAKEGKNAGAIIGMLVQSGDATESADGVLELVSDDENSAVRPKPYKAVVVGMAALDAIFRIDEMPARNQSVQVRSFSLHPGGKGLVQAVAARRLGMDVELVAAVGSDAFADIIIKYLAGSGDADKIGTSLIKRVGGPVSHPHVNTPVTGVIKFTDSTSMALGWKNQKKVSLTEADLKDERIEAAVKGADVVFITFELESPDMFKETIRILDSYRGDSPKPLIFVTPAPPYDYLAEVGSDTLQKIDYLIAHEWEVKRLLRIHDTSAEIPFLRLAGVCRRYGLKCVFVLDRHEGYHNKQNLSIIEARHVTAKDAAGSRDAFTVALAKKILDNGLKFSPEAVDWAAAAWTVAATKEESDGVPDTMPTLEMIDNMLDNMRPDEDEGSS